MIMSCSMSSKEKQVFCSFYYFYTVSFMIQTCRCFVIIQYLLWKWNWKSTCTHIIENTRIYTWHFTRHDFLGFPRVINGLSMWYIGGIHRCNPQDISFWTEANNICTYSFIGHEVIHLIMFYHVDDMGFSEANREFQCSTEECSHL